VNLKHPLRQIETNPRDSRQIPGTGALTFNGGELKLLSTFNLVSGRAITLNGLSPGLAGGGTIDANGFQTTITQGITGAGGLTITDSSTTGTGRVILTGSNLYAAGTTISSGTLQLGNGGATGSILGGVVDNGALAFDHNNAVTFPGAISGTGSVSQIGPGSTTLTGANTYAGGTLLTAGELIAGNISALGTGALTVAANAAGTTLDNTAAATSLANAIILNPSANLTVAGSNPLTLAGAISGGGALTKNGASTLILTADNTYAGGTTINTGTLQVGNGGVSGSVGTGPVIDNSALVFNRSGIVTVPGAITGTGSLTQQGVAGGALVLTGANTYAGGTTITSGV
jgi:fibronectin-binding autotransporter adhesin